MNNLATDTIVNNKINTSNFIARHNCQVKEVVKLAKSTFQFELLSPVGTSLDYYAGQHLKLELDVNNDGQMHSLLYSIANSFESAKPRRLELIIENVSEFSGKIIQRLIEACNNKINIDVMLAMGQAYLQTDLSFPHVLVAAGSGISKVKCIAEEILKQNPYADLCVYWSNRNVDDFYLLDEFHALQNQHKNFKFIQILESNHEQWSGRSGYIYQVLEQDFKDLKDAQMYLCGSPKMVYGTIDKLKGLGLREESCYSDVFEYAPRS